MVYAVFGKSSQDFDVVIDVEGGCLCFHVLM